MFQSFSIVIFVKVQMVLHLARESVLKLASMHLKCYPVEETGRSVLGDEFFNNFVCFFYWFLVCIGFLR